MVAGNGTLWKGERVWLWPGQETVQEENMLIFLDEDHLLCGVVWCVSVCLSTGMHLCVHVCLFVHIHVYYMYVTVYSRMWRSEDNLRSHLSSGTPLFLSETESPTEIGIVGWPVSLRKTYIPGVHVLMCMWVHAWVRVYVNMYVGSCMCEGICEMHM